MLWNSCLYQDIAKQLLSYVNVTLIYAVNDLGRNNVSATLDIYEELPCCLQCRTVWASFNSPFGEGHGLVLNLQIHQSQE
jgi:hypothetical protein